MPRLSVWIIRAALLHLGVGFTFGALMLSNKGIPFEWRIWRLVPTHMELLILGWTLQLAMGVAFWIMPRFSGQDRYRRVPAAWAAFGLLNAGIIVVAIAGWVGGAELALVGRIAELLSALLFGYHLWPRIKALGGQAAGAS